MQIVHEEVIISFLFFLHFAANVQFTTYLHY